VSIGFVMLLRSCYSGNYVVNGKAVDGLTVAWHASIVAFHVVAAGVLLIAAALPAGALSTLLGECHDCGLDGLVEVHDADDVERAYSVGAGLMGVNNRDLRTLDVDLDVTESIGPLIGQCVLLVSESGIGSPGDARRVRAAGARAVLVGEALVCTPHEHLADAIAGLRSPPGDGRAAR
jgi:indole-3-glycerol phosphate synthase